jgi:hypothetical protein
MRGGTPSRSTYAGLSTLSGISLFPAVLNIDMFTVADQLQK